MKVIFSRIYFTFPHGQNTLGPFNSVLLKWKESLASTHAWVTGITQYTRCILLQYNFNWYSIYSVKPRGEINCLPVHCGLNAKPWLPSTFLMALGTAFLSAQERITSQYYILTSKTWTIFFSSTRTNWFGHTV